MRLWHFTCSCCGPRVAAEGLTLGSVVLPSKIVLEGQLGRDHLGVPLKKVYGWQWLTSDPSPSRQHWATRTMLRCDRTEYRFAVKAGEARPWRDAVTALGMPVYYINHLAEVGGDEHWWLVHGDIPASLLTQEKP